jgi:hypothetical protein
MAEAEVTALCALALERVDPRSSSRPSRQWLLQRLAELRSDHGLFGGAATNGVCSLALLELMRDSNARELRVTVDFPGARRTVDLPPDRWVTLPIDDQPGTVRSEGSELVHYVLLAEGQAPRLAPVVANVTPQGQGRVGLLRATATNAATEVLRSAEMRVQLPMGTDAYVPDLDQAAAAGTIGAYLVDRGVVRLLLGDIAPGGTHTVSFRLRARRVSRLAETACEAELVPVGAAPSSVGLRVYGP